MLLNDRVKAKYMLAFCNSFLKSCCENFETFAEKDGSRYFEKRWCSMSVTMVSLRRKF